MFKVRTRAHLITLAWLLLSSIAPTICQAESVSLAKNVVRQPPADLLSEKGQPLEAGAAAALATAGTDLSLLNPENDKLWQNQSYPIDEPQGSYPENGGAVRFLYREANGRFTTMARVQSEDDPSRYFRLTLSRFSHSVLLRAALMRKLGYFIPSPKFYSKLSLRFAAPADADAFLKSAQEDTISDFADRKWVKRTDPVTFVISDAVLEPAQAEYFDLHWASLPNPHNPKHRPIIQQFSRYRAWRAAIVPIVLVDIPESVNRFSPKAGSVYADSVVLTHDSAAFFSAAGSTYEDTRWLVRRVANLTAEDWKEIVDYAHFPAEVDRLVYAKLIHRVKNLCELFSVNFSDAIELPDLRFTTPSGLIVKGSVTKEYIDGYPQRFSHGDREVPFSNIDITRYLFIDAVSSGIKALLDKANAHFVIQGVDDLAEKRREEIQEKITQHIKQNPFEKLYQDRETWGGPIGNFNVATSRHITTGTYYDSHAPLQLVDDLSVSASIGYFRALDGFAGFMPIAAGNLALTRNYTHVRPIESVKAGMKESWKSVLTAPYMWNLADILDGEEGGILVTKPARDGKTKRKPPLDEFLSQLKNGEVFNITDSIQPALYVQNNSPLDILFSFSPTNFLSFLSFGGDVSRVFTRQTSFLRTPIGIQVFVRNLDTGVKGLQFDVNYFLNLLKLRASTTSSDVQTRAYLIDYNSEMGALIDTTKPPEKGSAAEKLLKSRENLRSALKVLFKDNETELFEAYFKDRRWDLRHELETGQFNAKFLAERLSKFSESHLLTITPPLNEEHPELKREDEQVTLYAYKKGRLVGRDIIGLLVDTIEGLLKKVGIIARAADPNPANALYGKAYWKIVDVEQDLSNRANRASQATQGEVYPKIGIVQNVWGGWHLAHDALIDTLKQVTDQFKDVDLGTHQIIEPGAFATTKSLDFYRITSNVSIFAAGLDRLRDLLLQPKNNSRDEAPASWSGWNPFDFFKTLFAKAREIFTPTMPSDLDFYTEVMSVLGGGDSAKGEKIYLTSCIEEERRRQPTHSERDEELRTGNAIYGHSYECLSSWFMDLLTLRRAYPHGDKKKETRWLTEVVANLEAHIPLPLLMKYLGRENYIFFIRINGFRTGDEDGDIEFFSNSSGDPARDFDVAGGLFTLYGSKTGIAEVELQRTNGSFR